MRPGSKGKGFSLIELLIVRGDHPHHRRDRDSQFHAESVAANHASAIASLRVINSAETTYAIQYEIGYTSTLANLGPPAAGSQPSSSAAEMIDDVFASGAKGGYVFTYVPGAADGNGHYQQYTLNADPSQLGRTGNNYYFSDHTCVISLNSATPASSSDSHIKEEEVFRTGG